MITGPFNAVDHQLSRLPGGNLPDPDFAPEPWALLLFQPPVSGAHQHSDRSDFAIRWHPGVISFIVASMLMVMLSVVFTARNPRYGAGKYLTVPLRRRRRRPDPAVTCHRSCGKAFSAKEYAIEDPVTPSIPARLIKKSLRIGKTFFRQRRDRLLVAHDQHQH